MEWLQVGVLVGIFVVWAAAVLAVLAILSMGRDRDARIDEWSKPVVRYRDGQMPFDIGAKPMLGIGMQASGYRD
jgi:hypothetical protein